MGDLNDSLMKNLLLIRSSVSSMLMLGIET